MKAPTATHLNFPHKTAVLDTQLFAKYMFARLNLRQFCLIFGVSSRNPARIKLTCCLLASYKSGQIRNWVKAPKKTIQLMIQILASEVEAKKKKKSERLGDQIWCGTYQDHGKILISINLGAISMKKGRMTPKRWPISVLMSFGLKMSFLEWQGMTLKQHFDFWKDSQMTPEWLPAFHCQSVILNVIPSFRCHSKMSHHITNDSRTPERHWE